MREAKEETAKGVSADDSGQDIVMSKEIGLLD